MKIKVSIRRKDIFSYIFLLVIAGACISIGIWALREQRFVSGVFGVSLGFLLILIPISMILRKN
ncbi:MAG: hypothetical protein FWH42_03720 [Dehalococcoidia bacterium]|nr:hypothetical protein [Dehalococcoidia bacterium]